MCLGCVRASWCVCVCVCARARVRVRERDRERERERERGIRMIYSFRPLPLMKGCGWMTYHLTVHTRIVPMSKKTNKLTTRETDRQTDRQLLLASTNELIVRNLPVYLYNACKLRSISVS